MMKFHIREKFIFITSVFFLTGCLLLSLLFFVLFNRFYVRSSEILEHDDTAARIHSIELLAQSTANRYETFLESTQQSTRRIADKITKALERDFTVSNPKIEIGDSFGRQNGILATASTSLVEVIIGGEKADDGTGQRMLRATSGIEPLLIESFLQSRIVKSAWIITQDSIVLSFPSTSFYLDTVKDISQIMTEDPRWSLFQSLSKTNKQVLWSQVYMDQFSHGQMISVGSLIYKEHQPCALVGVDIDLDVMMHAETSSVVPSTDTRFLLDQTGSILFMPDDVVTLLGMVHLSGNAVPAPRSAVLSLTDSNNPDVQHLFTTIQNESVATRPLTIGNDVYSIVVAKLSTIGWIYGEIRKQSEVNSSVALLQSELHPMYSRYVKHAALTIFVLLSILLLFCLLFFRRHLVTPLDTILHAVVDIEAGHSPPGPVVTSRDELGDVAREIDFMAQALDVEHKRLRVTRKKYQDIVENAPVGIFQSDIDGTLISVNQTAARILGYTDADECLAEPITMLERIDDSDLVHVLKQTIVTQGYFEYVELSLRGKKSQVFIRITGRIVHTDGHGHGLVEGMFEDLHQQKQQERIESELAKADGINKARAAFLTTVSHEVRTPLRSLLGSLDVLEKSGLTDQQEKVVSMMRNSGELLINIMNDLIELAQLEKNEVQVNTASFDLRHLIYETARMFESQAQSKGLHLSVEMEPDLMAYRLGDECKLKQSLGHIIANAIKFTDSGSIRISAQATALPHEVLLCVQDTGLGINKKDHKIIFENFVQADSSATRKFGGAGLGLSIANRLVQLMNGVIRLESDIGEGALFTIQIPLPLASQPLEETQESSKHSPLYTGTVLIVDDFILGRNLVEFYLEDTGVSLDMAENGDEAVEAARVKKYDLILMDIEMPGMDGFSATACIREIERKQGLSPTPIYALTAHAYDNYRDKSAKVGLNGFLTTPLTRDHLLAIIEKELSVHGAKGSHHHLLTTSDA